MKQEKFEDIFAVAAALEERGLPPGVKAITVGYKRIGGESTNEPALVFLVEEKKGKDALHVSMAIPLEIERIPTDVVEIKALPQQLEGTPYDRIEPLLGGISMKVEGKKGLGTLGGIFADKQTKQPMGLTNRHVVDSFWFNPIGKRIYQPEEAANALIGVVRRDNKRLDCAAIALDLDVRKVDRTRSFFNDGGRIVDIARAIVDAQVFKIGARTGRTEGVVYSSGPSAVEIRRIDGRPSYELSDEGDSGSIWALSRPKGGHVAVALHWGGESGLAFCKPMIEVAKALELEVME